MFPVKHNKIPYFKYLPSEAKNNPELQMFFPIAKTFPDSILNGYRTKVEYWDA